MDMGFVEGIRTRKRTSMSASAARDGILDVEVPEDAKRTRSVSASSFSYKS